MDEEEKNETKENLVEGAKNLKNETKETVNQVKDSIKNTDFKADTRETKNFLLDMFERPFDEVKRAADKEENFLSKDIILMIIYLIAALVYQLIAGFRYDYGFLYVLKRFVISGVLLPAVTVLAPTIFIYITNKENKQSLITILSMVIVAHVPVIISEIVSVIAVLFSGISILTTPIITMLKALTYILLYVGMKEIYREEDDNKFIKKYAGAVLIYAFAIKLISLI